MVWQIKLCECTCESSPIKLIFFVLVLVIENIFFTSISVFNLSVFEWVKEGVHKIDVVVGKKPVKGAPLTVNGMIN